jgi:predicted HNH restriction endonuclease
MHSSLAEALRDLGWFSAEGAGTDPFSPLSDESSSLEGEVRRTLEIHRQREASLRRAKLDRFRQENDGRLFCQVPRCGFDFEMVYGELGTGFAEVHHLRPLSELVQPVSTTLADLAVICANCHRMIHRYNECRPLDVIIPASES